MALCFLFPGFAVASFPIRVGNKHHVLLKEMSPEVSVGVMYRNDGCRRSLIKPLFQKLVSLGSVNCYGTLP